MVKIPTRNFSPAKYDRAIKFIVFHGISADESSLNRWVTDPESEFSLHYFIPNPQVVIQYVDTKDVAWHSGDTLHHKNINLNSVGVGITRGAWNVDLIETLSELAAEICDKYKLEPSLSTLCLHQQFDPDSVSALPVTDGEFAKLIQLTSAKYMEIQRLHRQVTELKAENTALKNRPVMPADASISNPPTLVAPKVVTKRLQRYGYGELITALVTKIFARR